MCHCSAVRNWTGTEGICFNSKLNHKNFLANVQQHACWLQFLYQTTLHLSKLQKPELFVCVIIIERRRDIWAVNLALTKKPPADLSSILYFNDHFDIGEWYLCKEYLTKYLCSVSFSRRLSSPFKAFSAPLNLHMGGNRAMQFFLSDKCFEHSTLLSIYWNLNIKWKTPPLNVCFVSYECIVGVFKICNFSAHHMCFVGDHVRRWRGGVVCLWWVWSRLLVEIVEKSLHRRQLQIHFFQQLPFLMSLSVPENYLYLDEIGRVSCILYSGLKQPVAAQTGLWRWSWRFLYRLTIPCLAPFFLWRLKIFVHPSSTGVVFFTYTVLRK